MRDASGKKLNLLNTGTVTTTETKTRLTRNSNAGVELNFESSRIGDDTSFESYLMIFLLIAGLIVSIAFLGLDEKWTENENQSKTPSVGIATPTKKLDAKSIDLINRHLHRVQKIGEIHALSAELDNMATKGRQVENMDIVLGQSKDPSVPYGLQLTGENQAEQVYNDLGSHREAFDDSFLPQQRVEARMSQKKWLKEYRLQRQKDYIKAFIENARNEGYEVTINSQLEVVAVKWVGKEKPFRFSQADEILEGE